MNHWFIDKKLPNIIQDFIRLCFSSLYEIQLSFFCSTLTCVIRNIYRSYLGVLKFYKIIGHFSISRYASLVSAIFLRLWWKLMCWIPSNNRLQKLIKPVENTYIPEYSERRRDLDPGWMLQDIPRLFITATDVSHSFFFFDCIFFNDIILRPD